LRFLFLTKIFSFRFVLSFFCPVSLTPYPLPLIPSSPTPHSDGYEIPGPTPLTVIRPSCKGVDITKIPSATSNTPIDPTKSYTFTSLYLLLHAAAVGLTIPQYVNMTRRLHCTFLPHSEAPSTAAFMQGDVDECELILTTAPISQSQSSKSNKRQKVSNWLVSDLVQLQQGSLLPNSSICAQNTPMNNNDYIAMSTSYGSDSSNPKRGPQKELDPSQITNPSSSNTGIITHKKQENPIIIVPAGQTLTFSFKNLGDLFSRGVYLKTTEPESSFEIQKPKPPPELTGAKLQAFSAFKSFTRPSVSNPGQTVTYELCSDPLILSSSQWNRVIGVVVTGKTYQFDSFNIFKNKDGSIDTPKLFDNCAGIYLHFDGEKIPPVISQWNVTSHKFAVSKRHQDQIVMSEVWEKLIQSAKKKVRSNPNLIF
jgi:hypothetical protein